MSRFSRKFRQCALVSALGAGLAAAPALAAPSGTLVYALPPATNITYLNPVTPTNYYDVVNAWAYESMYKPLFWVDHRIQVDYARSIASSITTKDGIHYFITLNPKWHWSDGKPVTTADVIFDYQLIKSISLKNSSNYGGWGIGGIPNDVVSVKALGPYRMEITLNQAYSPNWFILNGAAQLIPLPKQAWDKYPGHPAKTLAYLQKRGDSLAFFRASPIDGPFRMTQSQHNVQFVMTANAEYDGHMPQYHKLVFRYFTSSDSEFNALRTGQLQIGYVPFHLYAEYHKLSGYRLAPSTSWGITYIYPSFLNPSAKALKDLVVRQALQMAVDQSAMVKVIYHGQAVAQYGPVPSQPSTYLSPSLKSGKVPYPYDPAKAKAMLEQAGWHPVHGVMTKGSERLAFSMKYASGSASTQQVAELFASAAAREGIKITLAPQPFDTIIGELASPKTWDLLYYGNGWVYYPDVYPTGYGLFGTGGGSDSSGYSNPTADRLIAATHAFTSAKKSLQSLYAYQDFLAKDLPVISLPEAAGSYTGAVGALTVYASGVGGILNHLNPVGLLSPQYWTLSK